MTRWQRRQPPLMIVSLASAHSTIIKGYPKGTLAGAMRGVAPTGLRVSEVRCTQGFRSQARYTPAY